MTERSLAELPDWWPVGWQGAEPWRGVGEEGPRTAGGERVRTSAMARVEAVLMVADGPLTAQRIARHAMLPGLREARQAIARLNAAYDGDGCAFRIERVAAGYRLLTRSHLAPWLNRLHRSGSTPRLSPPAMETLTIVAYRQRCTRADVDAIRGVQSAEMLKDLMERRLVRIAGADDSLGRPYLYETTKKFLELYGLGSLAELPRAEELRSNE